MSSVNSSKGGWMSRYYQIETWSGKKSLCLVEADMRQYNRMDKNIDSSTAFSFFPLDAQVHVLMNSLTFRKTHFWFPPPEFLIQYDQKNSYFEKFPQVINAQERLGTDLCGHILTFGLING